MTEGVKTLRPNVDCILNNLTQAVHDLGLLVTKVHIDIFTDAFEALKSLDCIFIVRYLFGLRHVSLL